MEIIQIIAITLSSIGALNWGLVGLFKFDLVAFLSGGKVFGQLTPISRTVYIGVGAAGAIAAATAGIL